MNAPENQKITFWGEIGKNTWLYGLLTGVFIISVIVSLTFDIKEIAQIIIAFPGGAAAVGLVVQIIRDNESHKRKLEIQKNDQGFSLAFTSYMSEHAFKKYAEFCEKYIEKLQSFSFAKTSYGTFKEYADQLKDIRRNYLMWLKSDVSNELEVFETCFLIISIKEEKIAHANSKEDKETFEKEQLKVIRQLYGLKEVINDNGESYVHLFNMVEKLKKILHIEDIYKLRQQHIENQVGN